MLRQEISHVHISDISFLTYTQLNIQQCLKDFSALKLVGPTRIHPVLDPLAVQQQTIYE